MDGAAGFGAPDLRVQRPHSQAGRSVLLGGALHAGDDSGAAGRRSRRCRLKLWQVLLGSFALTLGMLSALVSGLWFRSYREAVHDLVKQNIGNLNKLWLSCEGSVDDLIVQLHMQTWLVEDMALQSFMAETVGVVQGAPDTDDWVPSYAPGQMDHLIQHMWFQLRRFSTLGGLFYADTNGTYLEYQRSWDPHEYQGNETYIFKYRPPDDRTDLARTCAEMCPPASNLTAGHEHVYAVDPSTGGYTEFLSSSEYDGRSISWWKAASSAEGRPAWSDMHASDGAVRPRAARAQVKRGEVAAVAGADFALEHFVRLLRNMCMSSDCRVFVVDRRGRMLSGSGGDDQAWGLGIGGQHRQRQWHETRDAWVLSVVGDLLARYGSLRNVSSGRAVRMDGAKEYVSSHHVLGRGPGSPDLDWIVLHVEPLTVYKNPMQAASEQSRAAIRARRTRLLAKLNDSMSVTAVLSAVCAACGALVMACIAAAVTRPLKEIQRDMQALASLEAGEMDSVLTSPHVSSSTVCKACGVVAQGSGMIQEVRDMRDSFESMANGLRSFCKYMDPQVVRLLVQSGQEAHLGVAKAEVTIFFSDIVGFTSIAERLEPCLLMDVLGRYLDEMCGIVMSHGGVVGEFIGDAIMAWWNAPVEVGVDHTAMAMCAALEQQAKLAELHGVWCQQGLPEVRARMGLARGQVLAGNIGSSERMKYGLVGDSVNLASRLENLCKRYGVRILVEDQARGAPHVDSNFLLRPIDIVAVKGRRGTTEVFELVARRAQGGGAAASWEVLQSFTDEFAAIHAMYRSMDFRAAAEALHRYRQRWPDDTPARLLQERCDALLGSPVADGWSPVQRLADK